jgi:hypothetical protein
MSSSGARDVIVYCRDYRCSHSVEMNADAFPDEVRVSDVEPRYNPFTLGGVIESITPPF